MSGLPPRTGAQVLVDQLRAQSVERVTCVPGESYLAVLDALRDSGIDVLVCRQEGGAAIMAEAAGKLTGRPASASSPGGRAPPTPPRACTSPARIRRR